MASGDLNIDLTKKKYAQKLQVFQRTIRRRLPFVVTIRGFRDLMGPKRPPRPIPNLSETDRNSVNPRPAGGCLNTPHEFFCE